MLVEHQLLMEKRNNANGTLQKIERGAMHVEHCWLKRGATLVGYCWVGGCVYSWVKPCLAKSNFSIVGSHVPEVSSMRKQMPNQPQIFFIFNKHATTVSSSVPKELIMGFIRLCLLDIPNLGYMLQHFLNCSLAYLHRPLILTLTLQKHLGYIPVASVWPKNATK